MRFGFMIVPVVLLFVAVPASARVWHVPADVTTITAAIDSAEAGDEVVIACGTWAENGMYLKSGITVRSETGLPDCVTIDASGLDWRDNIFEIWFSTGVRLEGLTLTGGLALSHYYGFSGGALLIAGSDFEMTDCVISGNEAYRAGGVVLMAEVEATFRRCVITGNTAGLVGGGVEVHSGVVLNAYDCVITGNTAAHGSDGWMESGSLTILHCCTVDLAQWDGDGEVQTNDEDCGGVRTEVRTWGAVKSLYR